MKEPLKLTIGHSCRTNPISINKRRWDPATAIFSSLIGTSARIVDGATGIILEPHRELHRERPKSPSRKTSQAMVAVETLEVESSQSKDETSEQRHSLKIDEAQSIDNSRERQVPATLNDKARPDYEVVETIARASGKSAGKMISSAFRGVLVDLPLATAEGFRYLPRLWGGEVNHYGDVTDWQSGGLVAGKSVVCGMGGGLRDVVMHPLNGARSGGMLGAAKGLGSGAGSLVSATLGAGVGVVAYPGQGIAKSLHSAMHGRTVRHIADARHVAGRWDAGLLDEMECLKVVNAYRDVQKRGR